jgi:phospholipid transport system substrate-binding protein
MLLWRNLMNMELAMPARFAVAFTLLLLIFASGAPARAQTEADAVTFVQGLGARAAEQVADPKASAAEREARLRRLVERNLDLQTLGRVVLGRYWEGMSESERAEFLPLYVGYLSRTYARSFVDLAPDSLKIRGSRMEGEMIVVLSEVSSPDGPFPIEWRVSRGPEGPRIVDVIAEGVSLAITQRAEFNSVIRRGGGQPAALLRALRERAAAQP